MREDFQRWYSLNLLKNSIPKKYNPELKIIVWSAHNDYLKILRGCNFIGENNSKLKFLYEDSIFMECKKKPKTKRGFKP